MRTCCKSDSKNGQADLFPVYALLPDKLIYTEPINKKCITLRRERSDAIHVNTVNYPWHTHLAMNCPECDDLKKTYDDCFQEFVVNRAKNWDYKQMSEDSINKCDDVFQVEYRILALGESFQHYTSTYYHFKQNYKSCVEICMKLKIEARKKKS